MGRMSSNIYKVWTITVQDFFHQPYPCFIEKTWSKHLCFFHVPPINRIEVTTKKITKSIPRMSYNSSQPVRCWSIRILLSGEFQSMAVSFKKDCEIENVTWSDSCRETERNLCCFTLFEYIYMCVCICTYTYVCNICIDSRGKSSANI